MDKSIEKKKFDSANVRKAIVAILCIVIYFVVTSLPTPEGLTIEGQKAIAFMAIAVIAWVFEVIPIGISAVLLVMLMPSLGIMTMNVAMENFMTASTLFIMSTFVIAAAFIDTGLGNRVSLYVSTMFGSKPDMVLLSYMLPTTLVSTVLLDIPTSVIFAGIAITLLEKNNCIPGKSNFGKSIMMGIPIASAIGGIGTPAGSGLNVLSIGLIKTFGNVEISFLDWTKIGLPMALIVSIIAWFIIKTMYPAEFKEVQGLDDVKNELKKLGPLSTAERKFLVIFILEIILWLTEGIHGVSAAVVAIIAAALLFFPGINLVTWDRAKGMINWELILLVCGANSLAMGIAKTGGSVWLANTILGGLAGSNLVIILLAVTAFGVFSHLLIPVSSAVIAVAVPVVSVLAINIGVNPAILALPIAFTASDVFLMPLDPIPLTTYGYKYWKMFDMMKPGFIISLIWIVICVVFMLVAQNLGIV